MSLRRLKVWSCALALLGVIAIASPPPCAAQDDESLDADDEPPSPPAEEGEAPASGEEGVAVPAAPEPEPAAGDPSPDLLARAVIGAGLGMRSFRRPVEGGVQRLGTVYFPAADVGIAVRVGPQNPFTIDLLIRYQTSLGLVITEPVLFGLNNQVDVRSEHAEVSVAPGWRLGDLPTSPRISIPIGGAFRNFFPADHHLQTPRYTLIGGSARVQLEANLGSAVRLRAGPEVQLYGILGTDLTDNGVSAPGYAYGAEASLEFRLSTTFLLEVQYRQSNAVSSSKAGASFLDIERFATIRLAGEM
jgi:hypothetical protein